MSSRLLVSAAGLIGLFAGIVVSALLLDRYSIWICLLGLLIGWAICKVLLRIVPLKTDQPATLFSRTMDTLARFGSGGVVIVIVLLFVFLTVDVRFTSPSKDRRNIIIFVLDTLRDDALGICGCDYASSSNIDRYFGKGMQIGGVRADSAWTGPSFASLFTGLPPSIHTVVEGNIPFLPEHETLASVLRRNGYFCGALMCNPVLPANMGFDTGFDLYDNRINQWDAIRTKAACLGLIPVLQSQSAFCLLVQFMDCHSPYLPKLLYDGSVVHPNNNSILDVSHISHDHKDPLFPVVPGIIRNYRALYQSSLRDADAAFGEIIRRYEMEGLMDNTWVILTSDHGEEFREHGSLDHCVTLYEEMTRVPLLLKGPSITAGLVLKEGHLSDIGSTITALLRVPDSRNTENHFVEALMDSPQSFAKVGQGIDLTSDDVGERVIRMETRRHGFAIGAVVRNGMKYIAPMHPEQQQPILENYYPRPWHGVEVYDLEADPGERNPVNLPENMADDWVIPWLEIMVELESEAIREPALSKETLEALKTLGYMR